MYRQNDPEILAMKQRMREAAEEKERIWNEENDEVLDILKWKKEAEEALRKAERAQKPIVTVENGPEYRKRKLFAMLDKKI